MSVESGNCQWHTGLECKSTSHYSPSETCTEPHILKSLINQDDAEEVSCSLFSLKSARGYLFLFNLSEKIHLASSPGKCATISIT